MLATPPQEQEKSAAPDSSGAQLNPYYQDLDRFLTKFEIALTHYEVLDVDRSATQQEIKLAYHKALALLYPPYKVSAQIPNDLMARMERAFSRISWAFSVLANFRRRGEYDKTVIPRIGDLTAPAPPPAPLPSQSPNRPAEEQGSRGAGEQGSNEPPIIDRRPQPPNHKEAAINIKHLPERPKVYNESSSSTGLKNRRRCERLKLSLPTRITGYDRKNGKWHEMTSTIDVSRTGLTLQLERRVRHGMVLHLNVPLPVKLRTHNYAASNYSVYALVRRIETPVNGKRVIGLEFIGERPPTGYLDKPWALFRTNKWNGVGRRIASRVERRESVSVEYFTDAGKLITRVVGQTENVSRGGARISVRAAPPEFDTVRVSCPSESFETFATVRNRYIGRDGFERLCIQFTDNKWPI